MFPENPVEVGRDGARISYAQNAEDILLDRVFGDRVGTFFDVGGNHPFIDNNTYFFYVRGWCGVNVEPTRRGHALFERHRPGDVNLAIAASDAEGEMTFYEVDDAEGLTGLSTLSSEVAEGRRAEGFAVVENRVPVRTVASLVAEHAIAPPDVMSIDVEGHEASVIRGIPLASWRPGAFVVESTVPLSGTPTHEEWEPILLAHGYVFAAFNGVNRFYLRSDLADRAPRLATPASVLDGYLRHDLVAHRMQADALREVLGRERAERDRERALHEEARQTWAWAKAQAQHAEAVWKQQCESFGVERSMWADALGRLDQARAEHERDRAAWAEERTALLAELEATRGRMRPYRLVDPFVSRGYGLARKIRRKLAS